MFLAYLNLSCAKGFFLPKKNLMSNTKMLNRGVNQLLYVSMTFNQEVQSSQLLWSQDNITTKQCEEKDRETGKRGKQKTDPTKNSV